MRMLSLVLAMACIPTPPSAELSGPLSEPPAPALESAVANPEPSPVRVVTDPTELTPPTEPRYGATHLLIAHQGAAGPSFDRDERAARDLAAELHRKVASGGDLTELARAHSDDPSGRRGGRLGTFATGTYAPAFEAAVASVAPGELAPLVQTPYGFHVARRDPVIEVELRQILLRVGPDDDEDSVLQRLLGLRTRISAGEAFAELAEGHSEHRPTADRQGKMGRLGRGQLTPDLELSAFELQPGQVSEPIRSPWGWHLLMREP